MCAGEPDDREPTWILDRSVLDASLRDTRPSVVLNVAQVSYIDRGSALAQRASDARGEFSCPKTMRVLGALMCLHALSATLLGPNHARAVMEWETMRRTLLLRAGPPWLL